MNLEFLATPPPLLTTSTTTTTATRNPGSATFVSANHQTLDFDQMGKATYHHDEINVCLNV